jgi:hypothetical protein
MTTPRGSLRTAGAAVDYCFSAGIVKTLGVCLLT